MTGLLLTDREGRTLQPGDLVAYHGSLYGERGEWEVHGHCYGCPACHGRWLRGEPVRMRLVPSGPGCDNLTCVAPASITLAGHPLPVRDGVKVLGDAQAGDVIDVEWMWPYQVAVTGIAPAGGVKVRMEWTTPGDLSGVLMATGNALATLAALMQEGLWTTTSTGKSPWGPSSTTRASRAPSSGITTTPSSAAGRCPWPLSSSLRS